MKEKVPFYLKLTGGMLLSYFLSLLLIQHIFDDYQPEIRKDAVKYLATKLNDAVAPVAKLFGREDPTKPSKPLISELKDRVIQVAPGVKASESENAQYNQINTKTTETKTVEVELSNGSKVKVKIPKDSNSAPPLELIEAVEGK